MFLHNILSSQRVKQTFSAKNMSMAHISVDLTLFFISYIFSEVFTRKGTEVRN